jgi:nicotinamidase-related amidase
MSHTSSIASNVATTAMKRVVGKLRPETTTMLLCDVQERFRPLMYHGETMIRTCQYLTSVAHLLQMPVVVTQQYTKVFGPTIADCFATKEQLEAAPMFEKKKFSMLTPEVSDHLTKQQNDDKETTTTSYILFGIEAHVCVQQTALDLLEVRVEPNHAIV